MIWAQQAHQIAADACDLGIQAATINACAWRARVDPDATISLVGAALALGAPLSAIFPSGGPPLQDDKQMITLAADLEGDTASLLKRAQDLCAGAEAALAEAHAAAKLAAAAARAAKDDRARAAAADAVAEACAMIGDCEAALEITGGILPGLEHAFHQLQAVPADLEDTYEAAYLHVRRGGKLPYAGDFLTGVPA